MLTLMQMLLLGAALTTALYFLLRATVLKIPRCKSRAKLHGKTAIITGANTGIGKATAMDLARRGARVIVACRSRDRAMEAIQEIVKKTGNNQVIFMQLDLASLGSVRSFADEFLRSEPRLDLLINNAGLIQHGRTVDGFGMTFAVNHLGHFLLTMLLLDRLKASGRSRVVNVSSMAYRYGNLDFECLKAHRDTVERPGMNDLFFMYCHSKLCNNLFTYELAKRLAGSDVTCYCLHPGAIKTGISRNYHWIVRVLFAPINFFYFIDTVSGAQTTLHCALRGSIEHLSGYYFADCAPVIDVLPKARDDAAAKKLWELSEYFCGLS